MGDQNQYDVIIVGAGPVGLFLGLCLSQLSISFIILEKRKDRTTHSRSIGVHPPALELLDELGLSDQFIREGICITRGHAYRDKHTLLGTLDFNLCPGKHRYIITIPQHQTEKILEDTIPDSHSVVRGHEVIDFKQEANHITVDIKSVDEGIKQVKASYLVGCDGKYSLVRERAGIVFKGDEYSSHYIMGDFEDNTNLGMKACIFLSDDGLVESFPLPKNIRRWVVELPERYNQGAPDQLADIITTRTGYEINMQCNRMLSTFIPEHYLAGNMQVGRVLLAGDSAHVLSPIGGQGMNLGWFDAWQLAQALKNNPGNQNNDNQYLHKWEQIRLKKARLAIKRAEFNMAIAQKHYWPGLRNTIVKRMLRFPFSYKMSQQFTMRGLL